MTDGAPIPFTPPHVSLNRVRLIDIPGAPVDPEALGQTGFQLISVAAMARYARERAGELALPDAYLEDCTKTRAELPHFITATLAGPGGRARGAAEEVTRRLGRNLGHLLLALHRGDAVNRAARGDWTGADWDRWARIQKVRLAGGLSSGILGEAILRHAREFLVEVGLEDALDLRLSPFRGATSLAGAARYLPRADGHCLAFDFGQTATKRGLVRIRRDTISELTLLPPVLSADELPVFPDADPVASAHRKKAFMVDAICATMDAAEARGIALLPDMIVCLATYVDGGRLVGLGDYNSLMELGPDARVILAGAIGKQTGRTHRIQLIHDGTAAAAVFAGEPDSVAVALGSALGVGFAPERADDLLRIDHLTDTRYDS